MTLTDAELASMRTTTGEALPDTCVIQRGTATTDSGGGATTAWVAAGTVDCRIAPAGQQGNETATGGRITAETEFILTVPHTTTIDTAYRVVTGGETYNVTALRDRSWPLTRRVEVKRLES
jgi:SPP1 family predicted phage head-tail adaptor